MAEEKKVAKKPEASVAETSKWNKFLSWGKTLPARIAKPFKNMWSELKRVTWPTKRKLIVYSCVVLAFMLAMMIVIGLFDLGASTLVKLLAGINA